MRTLSLLVALSMSLGLLSAYLAGYYKIMAEKAPNKRSASLPYSNRDLCLQYRLWAILVPFLTASVGLSANKVSVSNQNVAVAAIVVAVYMALAFFLAYVGIARAKKKLIAQS